MVLTNSIARIITNDELVNFYGSKYSYNGVFRECSQNVLTHITKEFYIKQIKNVFNKPRVNSSDELFFDRLTFVVLPIFLFGNENIELVPYFSFYRNGFKVTINASNYLKEDGMKKIVFDDKLIGIFYPKRNLIICFIDIFTNPPRIKPFDNIISLFFTANKQEYKEIPLTDEEKINRKISSFSSVIENNYRGAINNLSSINRDIDSFNKTIIEYIRKAEIQEQMIKSLSDFKNSFKQNFIKKYDELKESTFLKSFDIKDGYIELNYGDIIIEDKGKNYYIGNMIAKIYPSKILFDNLNNRARQGLIHPHVRMDGSACFGSFQNDINRLIANFDFKKLSILLRQFLYTWNSKSSINQITEWKEQSFEKLRKKPNNNVNTISNGETFNNQISNINVLSEQQKREFQKRYYGNKKHINNIIKIIKEDSYTANNEGALL